MANLNPGELKLSGDGVKKIKFSLSDFQIRPTIDYRLNAAAFNYQGDPDFDFWLKNDHKNKNLNWLLKFNLSCGLKFKLNSGGDIDNEIKGELVIVEFSIDQLTDMLEVNAIIKKESLVRNG